MAQRGMGAGRVRAKPTRLDRPSADQPDCVFAQLDRERLQRYGAGSRLDDARKRLERALRTAHHLAAADVIARAVPRALKASFLGHMPLAQRGEEVAAAVRDRKRLAGADAYGQGAVRCLLHHRDLRVSELGDGYKAGGGLLGGAHLSTIS